MWSCATNIEMSSSAHCWRDLRPWTRRFIARGGLDDGAYCLTPARHHRLHLTESDAASGFAHCEAGGGRRRSLRGRDLRSPSAIRSQVAAAALSPGGGKPHQRSLVAPGAGPHRHPHLRQRPPSRVSFDRVWMTGEILRARCESSPVDHDARMGESKRKAGGAGWAIRPERARQGRRETRRAAAARLPLRRGWPRVGPQPRCVPCSSPRSRRRHGARSRSHA